MRSWKAATWLSTDFDSVSMCSCVCIWGRRVILRNKFENVSNYLRKLNTPAPPTSSRLLPKQGSRHKPGNLGRFGDKHMEFVQHGNITSWDFICDAISLLIFTSTATLSRDWTGTMVCVFFLWYWVTWPCYFLSPTCICLKNKAPKCNFPFSVSYFLHPFHFPNTAVFLLACKSVDRPSCFKFSFNAAQYFKPDLDGNSWGDFLCIKKNDKIIIVFLIYHIL